MKKLFAFILSLGLIISPVMAQAPQCDHVVQEKGQFKNQAITLVTSSIGANIMLNCTLASMQFSVMAFFAGSLTHVLTEIMAGKSMKKLQEANNDSLLQLQETMVQGGDLQKGIYEKALADEEQKKKFVEKRIKWLGIVKTMYTVATALAVAELIKEYASLGTWNSIAACAPNPGPSMATALAITAAYTYQNVKSGGLLQAAMFLLLPIHNSLVPAMYNHAIPRIATFGAATIFVGKVVKELQDIRDKIQCRIDKLNYLLSKFNKDSNPTNNLGQTSGAGGGELNPNDPTQLAAGRLRKLADGTNVGRICAATGSGGTSFNESNCARPLQLTRSGVDLGLGVNALTAAGNAVADIGDAVSSGDIDRAEVLGAQLASQAGRFGKMRDDLMKKANESLKAKGKKEIDFNGEINKRVASMSADMNNAINKNRSGSLAGFSEAELGEDLKGADSLKEELSTTAITSAPLAPATPIDATDLSGIGEGGAEEAALDTAAAGSNAPSLSDSLDQYESSESDISKDSSVSIFKQLSNRYILNYTKIFNRKEATPEATPQEPKKE